MQPLPVISMPAQGVIVTITNENSWPVGSLGIGHIRYAFLATDSTADFSLVSLRAATHPERVLRVTSRPAALEGFEHGAVIEIHLSADLRENQSVEVHFAQTGATVYFPPQPIDGRAPQLAAE